MSETTYDIVRGACDDGMPYVPAVHCRRCGKFVGRNGSIEIEHFGMSNEVASVTGECARCLALQSHGWTVCHEEVADRDGDAVPCDRLAFGERIDPENLRPYPVCRKHYRPPYRLCAWVFGGRAYCTEHDAPWPLGESWCYKAFEATR